MSGFITKKSRIVQNEWNLVVAPWDGAFGIEEVDDELAVPALMCWFCRGYPREVVQHTVDLHNEFWKGKTECVRR
jgi:hypothetical protein